MNQEIDAAKEMCTEAFNNIFKQAMGMDITIPHGPVKDGVKMTIDWDITKVISLEVQEEFLEFFLEHRATVVHMCVSYNMWERYVPHRPPTEEELAELGWPTEWVNTHSEFLKRFE